MNDGATYAEARWWFVYLRVFTPSDLADAMAVSDEVAERFIRAAVWHGIVIDSGGSVNGTGPPENIFEWKPLPVGPRRHYTHAPEWKITPGCYDLAPVRGMPVRLRSERDQRKSLSTPGARGVHKRRELAYERQEQARLKRIEEQKAKAQKDPKWKRRK
jgi:hypothetical protein